MEPALGGLIHPEMTGLIGLVFALGLRHGFDPDHLVAIDGMTRSSARVRPGMSRWSGLFRAGSSSSAPGYRSACFLCSGSATC